MKNFLKLAKYLDQGKVIGWFNGPMEFGPSALGSRSLLEIQEFKNAKFNESKDQI